jgi:hypothetical protein
MESTAVGAAALGRRSTSAGSLRLALALLAGAAAVGCGAETALFLDSPGQPWVSFLFPLVAGVYVCAGLLAWERRPSNQLGAVLYACSLPLLLAGLESLATIPALALVGMVVAVGAAAGPPQERVITY